MSNILRTPGIYRYDYGKVAKLVIYDKELNTGAKAIYCYLSSYTGSGEVALPVNIICEEISISDKTYQSYMRELIDNGYVYVEQSRKLCNFSYNIYTLNNSIKGSRVKEIILGTPLLKGVAQQIDTLSEYENIDMCGYGKVPKTVTTDDKLSLNAKVVYCLFSIHYSSGYKPLKTTDAVNVLQITDRTYYKAVKELEEKEHLVKKKSRLKVGTAKKFWS